MCDCLEREGDRIVDMDMICERTGARSKLNGGTGIPKHKSEDCHDVQAVHPIV